MESKNSARHGSGAFDIRNIIGALLGLYGIVLVVLGIVDFTTGEAARSGGINANLWTGIGMIVLAALMMLWAYLRPIVPDETRDVVTSGDAAAGSKSGTGDDGPAADA